MNGDFRPLICVHCHKYITRTNLEQDIQAFCDPTCLESFKCEQSEESKEELLDTIAYHEQRERNQQEVIE